MAGSKKGISAAWVGVVLTLVVHFGGSLWLFAQVYFQQQAIIKNQDKRELMVDRKLEGIEEQLGRLSDKVGRLSSPQWRQWKELSSSPSR